MRAAALLGAITLFLACNPRTLTGRQQAALQPQASRHQLAARAPRATGREILRRGWGGGAGDLGRRDEASRPGPMSVALDSQDRLHLLDQVNRRVLRFDRDGASLGALPIESETAEDLVPAADRTFVLYYDPGPDPGYHVVAHGPAGEALQSQRLHRTIQLATGLFATGPTDAPDLWVERRHTDQVQVARRGLLLAEEAQTSVRLGRASRRGGPRLLIGREGRTAVVHRVEADRYTSVLFEVEAPLPVVAVDDWLIGDAGRVLLSLLLEGGEGRLQRRLVLLGPGAGLLGEWELPATRGADALRTLALGTGSRIVSLESDAAGVSLRGLELP